MFNFYGCANILLRMVKIFNPENLCTTTASLLLNRQFNGKGNLSICQS